jgi:hypothetical protein
MADATVTNGDEKQDEPSLSLNDLQLCAGELIGSAALYEVAMRALHDLSLCEACLEGDHEHCGMQSWCECDHCDDGAAWV